MRDARLYHLIKEYPIRFGGTAPAGCKSWNPINPGLLEITEEMVIVSGRLRQSVQLEVGPTVVKVMVGLLTGWFMSLRSPDQIVPTKIRIDPRRYNAVHDPAGERMSLELPDGRWVSFAAAGNSPREKAIVSKALAAAYGANLHEGKIRSWTLSEIVMVAVIALAALMLAVVFLVAD